MNLDVRAHLTHRWSISVSSGTVYCRTCDLYLTNLSAIAIEIQIDDGFCIEVLTPIEEGA